MLKKNLEKQKFNKILRLIRKDAQKGLECFYEEYGRMIYLTAKNTGCSDEKANVVVNTVLIKIWRKAKELSEISNPKAWICTVTKNCARDELSEVWQLELKEEICATDDDFHKVIDKNGFEYLISPLKEIERELFILKFMGGYTFQDIANSFGKPLPTITTIYYRALEKIKNFLQNE
ncbi:MAG: sigma-70 family RNA polymerase sigma factor [Clostridia bacterium]|nr:sigma-70 family RNA polymerase sigma factor [Clostridia bacterium]